MIIDAQPTDKLRAASQWESGPRRLPCREIGRQRAFVGVLDRMGASASSARELLAAAGFLGQDAPGTQAKLGQDR